MASQRENDVALLLAAQSHLGTKNCTAHMERYVHKRRKDGIYVFNLGKTYEKLSLAARIIVAIENPQDIVCISARPYGQRGVLKFANYIGARSTVGRHTPGTLELVRLWWGNRWTTRFVLEMGGTDLRTIMDDCCVFRIPMYV